MFGSSKQTVENEHGSYFYRHLTEVEFYEFIARVADEVYHASNSLKSQDLDWQSLYARRMAVEPLESKIYELLVTKFANESSMP